VEPAIPDHYDSTYREFIADASADVRRQAFGADIGQNSWLTVDELTRFTGWLRAAPATRLLDVACGSGGPTLWVARQSGCVVVGIDMSGAAVAAALTQRDAAGLAASAAFQQADANEPLPFADGSFDAILCVDAINHVRDRRRLLGEWWRVLRRGGRVVFTDPITVTGPLGSDEIAIRASIGFCLFVPPGADQQLLIEAGFAVVACEDSTPVMAGVARRRVDARADHATSLRQAEGADAFAARQRFFETAAVLAHERRLSRFVYVAEKPA
jgi:SAM-dependent methyltransferase